jgi:hypothetical protein
VTQRELVPGPGCRGSLLLGVSLNYQHSTLGTAIPATLHHPRTPGLLLTLFLRLECHGLLHITVKCYSL